MIKEDKRHKKEASNNQPCLQPLGLTHDRSIVEAVIRENGRILLKILGMLVVVGQWLRDIIDVPLRLYEDFGEKHELAEFDRVGHRLQLWYQIVIAS